MEGGPGRDRNGEKESRLEIGPEPQKAVVPWSRTTNKGGGEKCSSLEYVWTVSCQDLLMAWMQDMKELETTCRF